MPYDKSDPHGAYQDLTLRHKLYGHKSMINHLAWSPDGHILATPSEDRTILLWNAQTGQLLQSLTGYSYSINSVAWSPDGHFLAAGSTNNTIHLWDVHEGQRVRVLRGHSSSIRCVIWSLDGRFLVSGADDNTIRLWDVYEGQLLRILKGHADAVYSVAWSPDGSILASGSLDNTIRLWDVYEGRLLRILKGHADAVYSVAWSPDGSILATGSKNIQIWEPNTGRQIRILEGHLGEIESLSFSYDGLFLASRSSTGEVRIWSINLWETVKILRGRVPTRQVWLPGIAFHPTSYTLATLDDDDTTACIWDLDAKLILEASPAISSVHYVNAKVVLVGDSGVGKSALGLVLTNQGFVPTESTHSRRVWSFDTQRVELNRAQIETREILLWDLAGQIGYRLTHQLHLNEIAVALVLFDSRSETDPFAGVTHWIRALRTAQRVQGLASPQTKKFLVAARTDRGGKSVSPQRIEAVMKELGFDEYFETSAKEGWNITALAEAVKKAVNWEMLPKVTSTSLFQRIKAFLTAEKESGLQLTTLDDLHRTFQKSESDMSEVKNISELFEPCIGRLEARGLIRRLSFGNLVLLQPELLDAYASALVNAVRDEPDGLGSISEEKVRVGDFPLPYDKGLLEKEQEKLLLLAMIEDLIRYEIVLREQSEDGAYLVFPSQSTRENPDLPEPQKKAMTFSFEGPVQNVYATLVVRLSHSGLFIKEQIWKNAVTYTTKLGGKYGLYLHNAGEGHAKLTLFFDKKASKETCSYFEEYVQTHLQRRALSESIIKQRIIVCPRCEEPFTEGQIEHRQKLGFRRIRCSVCDTEVSLSEKEERFKLQKMHQSSFIAEMDHAADKRRDREAATLIVQGKIETRDFDVFLCYNVKDKTEVKRIGELLKERGLLPWFDEWELQPGLPWQRVLEKQIRHIKSAAVFVGRDGIGPWQKLEIEGFLFEFVKRKCPVIPVLLTDMRKKPQLPIFLKGMTWVDLHDGHTYSIERLIWGITGKRSGK